MILPHNLCKWKIYTVGKIVKEEISSVSLYCDVSSGLDPVRQRWPGYTSGRFFMK